MRYFPLFLLVAGCTPAPKLSYVTNLDPPPTQFDQRKISQRDSFKLALELAYAQQEAKLERARIRWQLSLSKTNFIK